MKSLLAKIQSWEMELLAIGILILVVGITFPYYLPLFGGFVILLFGYGVISNRIKLPKWNWLPYSGVVLFFLWGFYNSEVQHSLVVRDLRNLIIVSVYGLLLFSWLDDDLKFQRFKLVAIRMVFTAITVISLIGLVKFLASLNGVEIEYFRVYDGMYPWGTSLINDTNYYALGGVVGLTAYAYAVYLKDQFVTRFKVHYLAGLVIIANVALAGSRRGIALLALVMAVSVGIWLFGKIKEALKGSKKNAIVLGVSTILLLVLVTTVKVRHALWIIEPTVEMVGLDYHQFKKKATIITFRYMTILDDELLIDEYYGQLWNEESTIDLSQIRALNTHGVESRRVRWNTAMNIYIKHTPAQKMIGSGFDYMQRYEYKYSYLHHSPDYPHSHFLSALLYSGLIGLLVFVVFIFQVIILYAKNLQYDTFFASLFFLVFSFNLISGNTHFSGKLLAVLCLVPLIYTNVFSKSK